MQPFSHPSETTIYQAVVFQFMRICFIALRYEFPAESGLFQRWFSGPDDCGLGELYRDPSFFQDIHCNEGPFRIPKMLSFCIFNSISTMNPVIAVDLGATNIRVAKISEVGVIGKKISTLTPAFPETPEDITDKIIGMVRSVAREDEIVEMDGIGISAAGPVNSFRGIVIRPPNIPLDTIPLAVRLGKNSGCRSVLSTTARPVHSVRCTLVMAKGAGILSISLCQQELVVEL